MRYLLILLTLLTVKGATFNSQVGSVRVNTDLTGTNTIAANIIATNLTGTGSKTGLMLRDAQVTNSIKMLGLAANRVAGIGSDRTITNTSVTIATLEALVAGGTNNWINEGTTNSKLAGIAKPWKVIATNSVEVGQSGEQGVLTLTSTNGTYSTILTTDGNGTLTGWASPFDDYDIAAISLGATNALSSGDIIHFMNGTNIEARIYNDGSGYFQNGYFEDSFGSDFYTRIQPGNVKINSGAGGDNIELDAGTHVIQMLQGGNVNFLVSPDSGWTNSGSLFLSDDGLFHPAGATINPTDGCYPYRSNATTFGDGLWYQINSERLGFGATNTFIENDTYGLNLGIGQSALRDLVPGSFPSDNVAVGDHAGAKITSGRDNTLVGNLAGQNITTGGNNTMVGEGAGAVATGSDNTLVGVQSGFGMTSGNANVLIGELTGVNFGGNGGVTFTTGSSNTFVGRYAGTALNSIIDSIAIGAHAVVTNSHEIVIGNPHNTKAIFPISSYTGAGTLFLSDDGTYKAASGSGPTINATDGRLSYRVNGTTLGDSPWYRISTNSMGFNGTSRFLFFDSANNNLELGESTLGSLTSGSQNVAIGDTLLNGLTSGMGNTFIGYNSGGVITSTHFNIGIGDYVMAAGTIGTDNIAIGDSTWNSGGAGGSFNVLIGGSAFNGSDGSANVVIGDSAGASSGGTYNNAIAIGADVKIQGSNTAQVGTNGVTVLYLNGTVGWFRGSGSPEGVVSAPSGSFYSNESGGATNTFWVKESGSGNSGWINK